MPSRNSRPPPSYASDYGDSGASSHRTYHIPDYSTSNERTLLVPNNGPSKPTSFIWIIAAAIILPAVLAFIVGLLITLPVDDPAAWRRDRVSYLHDRDLWQEQKRAHIGEELIWDQKRFAFDGEQIGWQKERVVFGQERIAMDKERADMRSAFDQERTTMDNERRDMRREFDHERAMMNNERAHMKRERDHMATERIVFDNDSARWANERVAWEQDMDRWGRERHWRDEQYDHAPPGAYWQEPIPDPHCHAYGKRKYTARIIAVPNGWNWVDACRALPIHIHEQTVLTPDMCVDTGRSGTYGHYVIDFGETACEEAMFTDFRDVGCVAKGSQVRRTEAQVRNINPEDDWKAICGTTPATINNVHYSGPSHCEERMWSKVGIWDIEDLNC